MGIGVSIFLMAVGAILAFAVDLPSNGIDLGVVGIILMLLGGLGLLAAMVLWNDWHPGRRRDVVDIHDDPMVVRRPTRVVEDRPVAYERPVVVEEPARERRITTRRSVSYRS